MNLGRKLRFYRIFDSEKNKTVILPFDHGLMLGPISGAENPHEVIRKTLEGGADAYLINPGIAEATSDLFKGKAGFICRISGQTVLSGDISEETQTWPVERAVRLGADAVAFTMFIGTKIETSRLKELGYIASECDKWNMPLLGEMIPFPKGEKGASEISDIESYYSPKYIAFAARIGAEIGADFIKTYYTGSVESFRKVVESCPIPIVIAGGPKMESEEKVLDTVQEAMKAGAAGVCIGRNVWQSSDPTAMERKIREIVYGE